MSTGSWRLTHLWPRNESVFEMLPFRFGDVVAPQLRLISVSPRCEMTTTRAPEKLEFFSKHFRFNENASLRPPRVRLVIRPQIGFLRFAVNAGTLGIIYTGFFSNAYTTHRTRLGTYDVNTRCSKLPIFSVRVKLIILNIINQYRVRGRYSGSGRPGTA